MNITRGPIKSPVRAVLYGVEGIGKTTLATNTPNPLILDTEKGSLQLDCARHVINDWKSLTLAVAGLAVDNNGFETVVIDSADWAVARLGEYVCATHNKKSLEDFAYGKGYVHVADGVSQFLRSCDVLAQNGLNVIFVAHSKVVRTSPPDQTDGYDRFELNLHKLVAPLFKEWCDLLVFLTYRTKLIEGGDGKMKGTGGKQRIMHTERSAAWDAKNRYGLPEEMPMAFAGLAGIFGTPAAVASTPDAMETMSRASAKIATADDKALDKIARTIGGLLTAATARDAKLTDSQWEVLTDQIQSRRAVLAQAEEVLA